VQSDIYSHPTVKPLSDQAKLLLHYLLCCKHHNALGCYHLPPAYIAGDLGWDIDTVCHTVSILVEVGIVKVCPVTDYVFIPHWLRYHPCMNAKHGLSLVKRFREIPGRFSFFAELIQAMERYGTHIDTRSLAAPAGGARV